MEEPLNTRIKKNWKLLVRKMDVLDSKDFLDGVFTSSCLEEQEQLLQLLSLAETAATGRIQFLHPPAISPDIPIKANECKVNTKEKNVLRNKIEKGLKESFRKVNGRLFSTSVNNNQQKPESKWTKLPSFRCRPNNHSASSEDFPSATIASVTKTPVVLNALDRCIIEDPLKLPKCHLLQQSRLTKKLVSCNDIYKASHDRQQLKKIYLSKSDLRQPDNSKYLQEDVISNNCGESFQNDFGKKRTAPRLRSKNNDESNAELTRNFTIYRAPENVINSQILAKVKKLELATAYDLKPHEMLRSGVDLYDIKISYVNSQRDFFIILKSEEPLLVALQDDMCSCYEYRGLFGRKVKVGDSCVVYVGKGRMRRGFVEEAFREEVCVFLVDSGKYVRVIRAVVGPLLKRHADLAAFAIRCCIMGSYGLPQKEHSIRLFKKTFKSHSDWKMMVCSLPCYETYPYEVSLYDQSLRCHHAFLN